MSVDVILDLQVNPENREELLSVFTAILPDTRAYKGCQSVVVTSDEDDRHNIVYLKSGISAVIMKAIWRGALNAETLISSLACCHHLQLSNT